MSDDVNMQANADHEFRAHADQHASLRLWLRLLSCTTRVEDKIRQKLRESVDITLPRCDLMAGGSTRRAYRKFRVESPQRCRRSGR